MIKLNSVLTDLINDNFIGVKQSFEDEGVLLDDVILMRRFTELNNLKLSVKIYRKERPEDKSRSSRGSREMRK